MENFEKCTVAMLGGPCSQHVTGNTSRQNHPQSAIICRIIVTSLALCNGHQKHAKAGIIRFKYPALVSYTQLYEAN